MTADGFDAATYGRSFADVYDEWYPGDEQTEQAVSVLHNLAAGGGRGGGRILELGVGTGRLSIPLASRDAASRETGGPTGGAALGATVSGIDPSPDMLDRLAHAADRAGVAIDATLGDAADPETWPSGPFDLVVAACNLVFNLADTDAQRRCFASAADRLTPEGAFVVEAFVPAPLEHRERRLEVKEVSAQRVVLIATDATESGAVVGQHIELVDGAPVRLRPWRICTAGVDALDAMAADVGLRVDQRHSDWAGHPFDHDSAGHVTIYRATS